jgi:phage shock protein A
MRLWNRLARVVTSDVHGVVDALEDRRLLLRQGLREAELALDRKRARLAALEAEARGLEEDERRLAREGAAADADVELALAEGRDDLARFAARRLLPLRDAARAAAERAQRLGQERERLAARIGEQDQELCALQARVKAELARLPADEDEPAAPRAAAVSDEDVELELLRRRRPDAAGGAR